MNTLDERLRVVFAEAFDTRPDLIDEGISVDSSAEWDSMRSIVLTSALESEFLIELSDDELVSLNSFQKIKEALLAKGIA